MERHTLDTNNNNNKRMQFKVFHIVTRLTKNAFWIFCRSKTRRKINQVENYEAVNLCLNGLNYNPYRLKRIAQSLEKWWALTRSAATKTKAKRLEIMCSFCLQLVRSFFFSLGFLHMLPQPKLLLLRLLLCGERVKWREQK